MGAAMPTTTVNPALEMFQSTIAQIRKTVELSRHLEKVAVTLTDTTPDLSDLYRGALSQAVGAVDHWAHQEIVQRAALIARNPTESRPGRLGDLPLTIRQAESLLSGDANIVDVVLGALDGAFGKATVQDTKALAKYFGYIRDGELWPAVSAWLRENVSDEVHCDTKGLCARWDALVERRHRIAHSVDFHDDGTGVRKPLDATTTEESILLIERVVTAITAILGTLPKAPVQEAPVRKYRPDSVSLINKAQALTDGVELDFVPAPYQRDLLGDWLSEDSRRGRATWVADGSWTPLKWAVNGGRYSPTGLVAELFAQAGVEPPFKDTVGPSRWRVDGQGTLAEIAVRLYAAEAGSQ